MTVEINTRHSTFLLHYNEVQLYLQRILLDWICVYRK